ncbi:hypothetical protein JAAARDRAFT_35650 [Jaapia argillacea MUCL 33604]|uniref:Uncharacterized protein n=1 Tax=Jaapia argillacea MUCL 33604 TaxID=933084 RepID=A0A067PQF7_9AGAM|nr:hypothetical protein JAAARDRAFT_35650 [Jaapia argillacea MUCL 33604]
MTTPGTTSPPSLARVRTNTSRSQGDPIKAEAEAASVHGEKKKRNKFYDILWTLVDWFFLGFAAKFYYRLVLYGRAVEKALEGEKKLNKERSDGIWKKSADEEKKADDRIWEDVANWRDGQQEEWNRMGTTTSLMATISAASLAFSGIDQAWWLGRAFFAGALGMSLCGFFTIHYFGVLAEGMDDDTVGRAAIGQLSGQTQRVVAGALAVPAALSAYSTLLILLGHIIFVLTISNRTQATTFSGILLEPGFKIVAGIPILVGVVMMLGAVIVAELMYLDGKKQKGDSGRQSAGRDIESATASGVTTGQGS